MKPIIRRATISDIPKLYEISQKTHQLSYGTLIPDSRRHDFDARYTFLKKTEEAYGVAMSRHLKNENWWVWVAEVHGEVVGYTQEKRENDHLILKKGLFVLPEYQKRGIGSMLFAASLEVAKAGDTLRLSVIGNNERAKRLYRKFGFEFVKADEKTYYGAKLEVMECMIH